jgi:hypothetical protein
VTDRMKAATGLPVEVDNDANAAAMAELWLGSPEIRKFRDFIKVSRDLVLELFLMDSSITVKPVRQVSSGT